MHYGKVDFKSALLIFVTIPVLYILMVGLTVYMLTVALETWLFTEPH